MKVKLSPRTPKKALLLTYFTVGAVHNFMEDCRRWEAPRENQRKGLKG